MSVTLSDSEERLLRQAQAACRGQAGYVPVTALLMLGQGHAAGTVALALGLHAASVYRYAEAYRRQGLAGCLGADAPGYWGPCSPAPNSRACAGNWAKPSTPTAGPWPTGWPPPTGCATRPRA